MQSLSARQLKRLQTLYGQYCSHTLQPSDRASRISWASSLVQRPLKSFSDLTIDDARHLIDTLQGQLGVRAPRSKRGRLNRSMAHQAGTAGRRGSRDTEAIMAGPADLARIQKALSLLDWNQDQFEAWLRSTRSPLKHKSSPQIRTLADSNRVWWALKGMLQARGLWKEKL